MPEGIAQPAHAFSDELLQWEDDGRAGAAHRFEELAPVSNQLGRAGTCT